MIRSKARIKSHGEVFTPPELVAQMLDQLPVEVWSDPSKTFCDPAGCGNGAFIVEVVKRKINAGSTPLQALQTTFGVDIMQDNVDECRESMLHHAEKASGQARTDEWIAIVTKNVVCHDALTYDFTFGEAK